jgi:CRP-like cAMP-binding protein
MNIRIPSDYLTNNLLRSLREKDIELLGPYLKEQHFQAGTVLYEAGDNVETVYFPTGPTLISYAVELADGRTVETLLVGREGAVGGIVSQGHLPAYARCLVQFSGPALVIQSTDLESAKHQSMALRHLFARYADCLVAQMFQSIACNAVHTIEQRTAKWLLAAIDRIGSQEVPLTQEQLASILGVGRSYTSRVISSMRKDSLVQTRRGKIRAGELDQLRHLACDCNDLVRAHFDRVLKGVCPREGELRT